MSQLSLPQGDVSQVERRRSALHNKLQHIHSVLATREIDSDEINRLLAEFQQALRLRFVEDEQLEGFFTEVKLRAPELAYEASKLSIRHKELIHRAHELCRFAAVGSPSLAWWRELRSRSNAFSKELIQFEREETELHQASCFGEMKQTV